MVGRSKEADKAKFNVQRSTFTAPRGGNAGVGSPRAPRRTSHKRSKFLCLFCFLCWNRKPLLGFGSSSTYSVAPRPFAAFSVAVTAAVAVLFTLGHLRSRRELRAGALESVPVQRQSVAVREGRPVTASLPAPKGVFGRLPPPQNTFRFSGNFIARNEGLPCTFV